MLFWFQSLQKTVALSSKIISAYFRGTRLKRAKSLSPPCEKVPECLFNFSGQDDVEGLRVIMTATRCRDDSAARPPADTLDESLSHPPPMLYEGVLQPSIGLAETRQKALRRF